MSTSRSRVAAVVLVDGAADASSAASSTLATVRLRELVGDLGGVLVAEVDLRLVRLGGAEGAGVEVAMAPDR